MAVPLIVFPALLAAASAGSFEACSFVNPDYCTVTALWITPAKLVGNRFHIRRGNNITIAFKFTPQIDATRLKTKISYNYNTSFIEAPLTGDNENGCSLVTCPLQSGTSQTIAATEFIAKIIPKGKFAVQMKLSNEENESQVCCAKFKVKINRE